MAKFKPIYGRPLFWAGTGILYLIIAKKKEWWPYNQSDSAVKGISGRASWEAIDQGRSSGKPYFTAKERKIIDWMLANKEAEAGTKFIKIRLVPISENTMEVHSYKYETQTIGRDPSWHKKMVEQIRIK